MLQELRGSNAALNIEIMGVNQGAYSCPPQPGNALPLLQDTDDQNVWGAWGVAWSDLRILDSQNNLFAVYNLSAYSLEVPQNRETLKSYFLAAAQLTDTDEDQLPDDWENKYFEALFAEPTDDPDSDGLDNCTEYAFGTDPLEQASHSAFHSQVVTNGTEKYLSVTFDRRMGAQVEYTVEASDDLITWSSSASKLIQTQAPQNLLRWKRHGPSGLQTHSAHHRPGACLPQSQGGAAIPVNLFSEYWPSYNTSGSLTMQSAAYNFCGSCLDKQTGSLPGRGHSSDLRQPITPTFDVSSISHPQLGWNYNSAHQLMCFGTIDDRAVAD